MVEGRDEEAGLEPTGAVASDVELVERVVENESRFYGRVEAEGGAGRHHGVAAEGGTVLGQALIP